MFQLACPVQHKHAPVKAAWHKPKALSKKTFESTQFRDPKHLIMMKDAIRLAMELEGNAVEFGDSGTIS
jgi:hypothetical protein